MMYVNIGNDNGEWYFDGAKIVIRMLEIMIVEDALLVLFRGGKVMNIKS